MSTFLFDQTIFGPVKSRRLGESLGINLLPTGRKVCNFNCVYCECGVTPEESLQPGLPSAEKVKDLLTRRLLEMKQNGEPLDSITFAGNGEPTLHPDFPRIIDDTIECRDRIFPGVNVTVLSNATLINDPEIFKALQKVDLNILKLDSAIEETLQLINCPRGNYSLSETINAMKKFNGKLVIQTLFLKGAHNGQSFNNASDREVEAWLAAVEEIKPESVMIYSLDRDTAVSGLERVSDPALIEIARKLKNKGISVLVTP